MFVTVFPGFTTCLMKKPRPSTDQRPYSCTYKSVQDQPTIASWDANSPHLVMAVIRMCAEGGSCARPDAVFADFRRLSDDHLPAQIEAELKSVKVSGKSATIFYAK